MKNVNEVLKRFVDAGSVDIRRVVNEESVWNDVIVSPTGDNGEDEFPYNVKRVRAVKRALRAAGFVFDACESDANTSCFVRGRYDEEEAVYVVYGADATNTVTGV